MCFTHILYVIFMYVQYYKQQQYILHMYIYVLHSPVWLYTTIQYISKANTSTNAVQIHVQRCSYIRATNRKQTAVRNTDAAPRVEE